VTDVWDASSQLTGEGKLPSLEAYLLACQEPFQREAPLLLDALFEKLDDALYDLADKAGSDRLYSRYFDAMRLFRNQSRNIKTIFLRQLQRTRELTASGLIQSDSTSFESYSLENFALLEDAELEKSIAVSNLVSKAENRYQHELHELGRHLGHLLGRRELPPAFNPLGPLAICDAFTAALQPLQDIDLPIKLVVYKLFDKQVMDHLGGIYDQCLRLAVAHGLAPSAATPGRTVSGHPLGASPDPHEVFALRPPQASQAASDTTPSTEGRVPFDSLRSLLNAWRDPQPAVGPDDPDEVVIIQTSDLMAILSRLQDASWKTRPGPFAAQELRARVDGALQTDPLAQGTRSRSLGEIDEDTLELVSLLFDSIIQAADLPDPIKVLVGRLQIPLVKVALLDKTLFDNPDHPARRLLNRIADATVGWAEDEERTPSSLYGRIERIVDRIIGQFDRDMAIFSDLDADLADYVAREGARARATEEQVCSVATERNRIAAARLKAQAVIDERLQAARRVPAVVESLLNEGWREVLYGAYLSGGAQGRKWLKAVDIVDRLLWSVQPKADPQDRRDLLRGIPELLRTLRAGLAAIDFDQRVVARWFRELQALHLTALRGAVAPQTTAESSAPTATHGHRAAGTEASDPLRRLAPGCWVELVRDDARRVRVKLAWVSADRQRLQFVDRQGYEGPELARDNLATLIEYGLASIVRNEDDPPLMDRAVATLRSSLSH
jgi:hypothetical protein